VTVEPRDGVRRRFAAVLPGRIEGEPERLKIELERDGFAAGRRLTVDKALGRIAFALENRTADAHRTGVRISAPDGRSPRLFREGRAVPLAATGDPDFPWRAEIDVAAPAVGVTLVLKKSR
jgi:hypothetical protein